MKDRFLIGTSYSIAYLIFSYIIIERMEDTPDFPDFFLYLIQLLITLFIVLAVFIGGFVHILILKIVSHIKNRSSSENIEY